MTVQIYSAPSGTSLAAESGGGNNPFNVIHALTGAGTPWSLATDTISTNTYLGSGVFSTTTINLNNAVAGNAVEMEVIAFTGTLQNPGFFGYSGDISSGGALGWVQPTGNAGSPPSPPANLVTGSSGFNGIFFETPEPSTYALGGLGAATLWLFRRRK